MNPAESQGMPIASPQTSITMNIFYVLEYISLNLTSGSKSKLDEQKHMYDKLTTWLLTNKSFLAIFLSDNNETYNKINQYLGAKRASERWCFQAKWRMETEPKQSAARERDACLSRNSSPPHKELFSSSSPRRHPYIGRSRATRCNTSVSIIVYQGQPMRSL